MAKPVAILLFASTVTAQTSTPAEFTELGELLVVRWVSDITLIADWPEFSKKVEGAGHLLFEDNGKTMVADGDLTLDGRPLLHYRDVYRRVAK
jgi:hypothetical protein